MVKGPVVERGVLMAAAQVWDAAVRWAGVTGRLAEKGTVGLAAVDVAAAELGVSRRQVYVLVARWRTGEGVVSDLLPDRSSGGRGGRLPDEVEEVPYRTLSRPLIRVWEQQAAVARLRELGRAEVDENAPARAGPGRWRHRRGGAVRGDRAVVTEDGLLDLSYLHETAQRIARLPAEERLRYVRADWWIGYTRAAAPTLRSRIRIGRRSRCWWCSCPPSRWWAGSAPRCWPRSARRCGRDSTGWPIWNSSCCGCCVGRGADAGDRRAVQRARRPG